jgi:hypothetical protein
LISPCHTTQLVLYSEFFPGILGEENQEEGSGDDMDGSCLGNVEGA